MKSIFKHVIKPSIISLIIFLTSCGSSNQMYCETLVGKLNDSDAVNTLELWAKDNVFQKDLKKSDVKFEGRIVPGFYRYPTEFNWQVLGFDEKKAQVRIVGPHTKDIVDEKVTNIKSVFFAERSRLGVLVKAPGTDDYGVGSDKEFLTPVSENVAVLCIPSD